jgi:hypothetical protein
MPTMKGKLISFFLGSNVLTFMLTILGLPFPVAFDERLMMLL